MLVKIGIIALIISTALCAEKSDLIIFTKDRPLQLQAYLESLEHYVTGLQDVVILCHTRDKRFADAYQKLEYQFPTVRFVYQDQRNPRGDFWRLVHKIFSQLSAPFCMFGVDDIIVIDYINVEACTALMQQTCAYGCYLLMGQDITHCYMTNTRKLPPALRTLPGNFCSWSLRAGIGPWGYAHSLNMTIYTRAQVSEILHAINVPSPNRFEEEWAGRGVPHDALGLCYATSVIINIPLNLVQHDCPGNRHSHLYGVEQLLELFEHGQRIDFQKLYKFPHNAPHVDVNIPFVKGH